MILRREDLLHFVFKLTDEDEIEKYSLEEIEKEFKIYSSIIDLNKSEVLRKELEPIEPNSDLRKSVLVCISLKVEFQWKKKIRIF